MFNALLPALLAPDSSAGQQQLALTLIDSVLFSSKEVRM